MPTELTNLFNNENNKNNDNSFLTAFLKFNCEFELH